MLKIILGLVIVGAVVGVWMYSSAESYQFKGVASEFREESFVLEGNYVALGEVAVMNLDSRVVTVFVTPNTEFSRRVVEARGLVASSETASNDGVLENVTLQEFQQDLSVINAFVTVNSAENIYKKDSFIAISVEYVVVAP